jgi:hypothetical protein
MANVSIILDRLKNGRKRVLRMVYLSPKDNEALRVMAFRINTSINEIIVEMLEKSFGLKRKVIRKK